MRTVRCLLRDRGLAYKSRMGEAILKTGRTGGIEDRAVAETLAIRVYNYFIMSLIPGQVLPHEN